MITGLLEVRHWFARSYCRHARAAILNPTTRRRQFTHRLFTLVSLQNSAKMNQILMKKMLLLIFHTLRSTKFSFVYKRLSSLKKMLASAHCALIARSIQPLCFLWCHHPRKLITLLHKSHLTHTMKFLWD